MLGEPAGFFAGRPLLELEILRPNQLPLKGRLTGSPTRSWAAWPRERPFKRMKAMVPTTVNSGIHQHRDLVAGEALIYLE